MTQGKGKQEDHSRTGMTTIRKRQDRKTTIRAREGRRRQ